MIYIKLVWAECVRTNVVRALVDIVATKLGIILLFLSSFHLFFSQKGFAYDFEFLHAFLRNKTNKILPQNMGGAHPFTPKIAISGRTAGMWAFFGGAEM